MKTITREQFDNLKHGYVLENLNGDTITVDFKLPNSIIGISECNEANTYSFNELVKYNYLLKEPKQYNSTAVKCDTVEQANWLLEKLDFGFRLSQKQIQNKACIYVEDINRGTWDYQIDVSSKIQVISFSEYCKQEGIEEPPLYCGFEVGDYSEKNVWVKVSDISIENAKNQNNAYRLLTVDNNKYPFIDANYNAWKYAVKLEL